SQAMAAAQASSTAAYPAVASTSSPPRPGVSAPGLLHQCLPQELRVLSRDRAGEPDQGGAAATPVLAGGGRLRQVERLQHELGHVRLPGCGGPVPPGLAVPL